MFTVEQIKEAHSKVKSGADFPKYIQDIKQLGVTAFKTWVVDSQTEYFGKNHFLKYSTRLLLKYSSAFSIKPASPKASLMCR